MMIKIGYQGIPGSYSEATLQIFAREFDIYHFESVGYDEFPKLIKDLTEKKLDYVVLPIENSTTGLIARAMDYLRHQPLFILNDHYTPVNHALLAQAGTDLEDIQAVYSHPEALEQCQNIFHRYPKWIQRGHTDTAEAALYVSKLPHKNGAAIASKRAADLYHLEVLIEDLPDEGGNTTRFVWLTHQDHVKTAAGNHLFYYVETHHRVGALFRILSIFNLFDVNLTSLNARPIPNQPFNYGFFIEADLSQMIKPYTSLNQALEEEAAFLQILGRFDRVKFEVEE